MKKKTDLININSKIPSKTESEEPYLEFEAVGVVKSLREIESCDVSIFSLQAAKV